jgi:hypothetical protein
MLNSFFKKKMVFFVTCPVCFINDTSDHRSRKMSEGLIDRADGKRWRHVDSSGLRTREWPRGSPPCRRSVPCARCQVTFTLHELAPQCRPPKPMTLRQKDCVQKPQRVLVAMRRVWSLHHRTSRGRPPETVAQTVAGAWPPGLIHWARTLPEPQHLPATSVFYFIMSTPHPLSPWKGYVGWLINLELHVCEYSFNSF